ncbi:hypothetical protein N9385_04095 [Candidatus Nitrosopelagicus sp.]|nr:hypothetical protein [Candidatus Nitrosopelagicus sp.]|tara:strand:- start:3496 stop:4065 length:570 start_codon:yes stop_codon:yes gene_type:complete
MLIASQNITNYDVNLPDDVIFRINLAWIDDLKTLKKILDEHKNHNIFIDLPKNRTKPPNNKYSMDEIKPILESYSNIKYFAISNVDSANYLTEYLNYLPKNVIAVPKIESSLGVKNIEEISNLLGNEKIVMLDHDDLYSSMSRNNDDPKNFQVYIQSLIDFCNQNNVTLLRTVGVIFADSEKRVSEYVK